jgi:hypothetical protein
VVLVSNKRLIVAVIVVLFLIIVGSLWFYYQWKQGAYMKVQGALLLSSIDVHENQGNGGIYKINLSNNIPELFFKDERYIEYGYPFQMGDDFYCSAQNREVGYYTLLQINNGITYELMTSKKRINFPVISQDLNFVWYLQYEKDIDKKQWVCSLWKYDRQKMIEEKIFDDRIKFSSGLLLDNNNSLILTQSSDENGNFNIIRISRDGNKELLITQAYCPSWYDMGKSIIYRSGKQINIFNLEKREDSNIGYDDGWWEYPPSVSPDKKYLAVIEYALINFIGSGERDNRLRIISIDGREKRNIPIFERGDKSWNINVFWMK